MSYFIAARSLDTLKTLFVIAWQIIAKWMIASASKFWPDLSKVRVNCLKFWIFQFYIIWNLRKFRVEEEWKPHIRQEEFASSSNGGWFSESLHWILQSWTWNFLPTGVSVRNVRIIPTPVSRIVKNFHFTLAWRFSNINFCTVPSATYPESV